MADDYDPMNEPVSLAGPGSALTINRRWYIHLSRTYSDSELYEAAYRVFARAGFPDGFQLRIRDLQRELTRQRGGTLSRFAQFLKGKFQWLPQRQKKTVKSRS